MVRYGQIAILLNGCILLILLTGLVSVSCDESRANPGPDPYPCPHVIPYGKITPIYHVAPGHVCCRCNQGEYVSDDCIKGLHKTTNCTVCPFDPNDPSNQSYITYGPHNSKKCYKAIEKCKKGEKRIPGSRFENAKCEPLPVPPGEVTNSPTTVVTSKRPLIIEVDAPSGRNIPLLVLLGALAFTLTVVLVVYCICRKEGNCSQRVPNDRTAEVRPICSGQDSGSNRPDSTSLGNVESTPSTSAARGTKYMETSLSEAAATSRCKPSYNELMEKIRDKLTDGEDNHYLDDDDMSKILGHLQKAAVVGDHGPSSRYYRRREYLFQGFRELMKLGEKEFNPQILLNVLRKYNLNSLADHFLKPICEENGYDLEEESPVPAEADGLEATSSSRRNSFAVTCVSQPVCQETMIGSEDENDPLLLHPPSSQEKTKSRNVESAPSTPAARGTKYTGTNLSEAATTSRYKLSYAELMAEIEEKFAYGEDNLYMDGDDMSRMLRHFKTPAVVGDHGPNSRDYARKRYISEGFRQLMKLGEKEFNPQILLKLLRKYKLNSLADHFLKPICEENGYDLEEESPVPAEAGSLGEPRVSSANGLEAESHGPRANGMEAESHGPRASGLEAESHGPRASGLEAESHGPRANGMEAESHSPRASSLEADSLVSRENGCGLDERSCIKDEPKS